MRTLSIVAGVWITSAAAVLAGNIAWVGSGGDGTNWTDRLNWNPSTEYPGETTAANDAFIENGNTVFFSSGTLPQNIGLFVRGESTLHVTGGTIGLDIQQNIVGGNNGGTLDLCGGNLVLNGNQLRIIGDGTDALPGVIDMTGGSITAAVNSLIVNGLGTYADAANRAATEIHLSGSATLTSGSGLLHLYLADGVYTDSRLTIAGTGVTVRLSDVFLRPSQASGAGTLCFVPDLAGVSPFVADYNLVLTGGNGSADLSVDLSNYHPGISGDTLVLCQYGTLTGSFGNTNVILGDNVLSYELDYAYQGNKIALVNVTHPPLQVATREVGEVTDTTAELAGEISFVDPGGADLWIYYGTNDGLNVAGDWQTNTWVGNSLSAGVYTGLVADLSEDRAYHYRAFAEHGGTGIWAATSQSFGTRFLWGIAPSNLTAQGGWDGVDLAWAESFNTEDGMVIARGTNAVFTGDVTQWFIAGVGLTGTVDTAPLFGVTGYYRVAATNTVGMSAWSDVVSTVATASMVTVTQTVLTASSIFKLQEETQKMALRGTRGAFINAWIDDTEVDLAQDNSFYDYGAPTNSGWYIDPYGTTGYTLFRESYAWSFDFGNGVTTNLELVPVHINFGGWRDNILLNLGYTGEITINGTNYIVDVVQGASPEFKERLSYPGYFNDPSVNILLYEKATTNRIANIGRMKFINGDWYSFDSNASGEQLTVSRMVGMGMLEIDAGPFQSSDLAFISGVIIHEGGWGLSLSDLVFSNAAAVLPAGKYEFSECMVTNAGKTYSFVYHPTILDAVGCIDIPPDGKDVLTIGQNYEIRVWLKNYQNPNRLHDYMWMDCQLIDHDMGAAVVPEKSEWISVSWCQNSTGGVVECEWEAPYGCGWNGAYLFVDQTRIGVSGSPFALPTDYDAPSVYDTRYLRIGATMTGLYGEVYTNVPFNVVNERKGLQARYYDFDLPLTSFPDFDNLLPDLEKLETNLMPASAVTEPWPGLPPEMADTFGLCYEFEFLQDSSSFYKAPANYSIYLKCQGAARVYWDGELILENVSHDAVTEVNAPLPSPVALGSYHQVRIEYYHNEGPAMLEARLSGTILIVINPPYPYPITHYFRPGERWSIAPAHVPPTLSVTGPVGTAYTAPASFTVSATAQHPDGIGGLEVFVDGVKTAGSTSAPDTFLLNDLPVNAAVSVRAADMFGYGVASNLNLTINREAFQSWMNRHGLTDSNGDEDGDGVTEREEFEADTNPTNGMSAFVIGTVDTSGLSNRVQWTGTRSPLVVSHYDLLCSDDLMGDPAVSWTAVVSRIPIDLSGNYSWWQQVGSADSNRYYRIRATSR